MRQLLFVSLALLSGVALAAKPKPGRAPPAAPPPPPAAQAPVAPAPVTLPAAPGPELPTAKLLEKARAALDALEYGQLLVLSEALVQRADATRAMQIEGYWLQGQAVAVLNDPVEAEPPFRALLRLDPTFEPPVDPGPKILATFRKVQVEERALAERLARVARARLVEGLSLTGEPAPKARGGRALPFSFRLKDPTGAVDEVRLHYRLEGSATPFSSLALLRSPDGHHAGEVPGEVTANPSGARLEYFVEAVDAQGLLLSRGDAQAPLRVELSAGNVGRALPRTWYHGALAATLVAAAATAGLGIGALIAERSHAALALPSPGGTSSEAWRNSLLTAQRLILSTLIGVGVTAVFAVVTAVLSRWVEQPDAAD